MISRIVYAALIALLTAMWLTVAGVHVDFIVYVSAAVAVVYVAAGSRRFVMSAPVQYALRAVENIGAPEYEPFNNHGDRDLFGD